MTERTPDEYAIDCQIAALIGWQAREYIDPHTGPATGRAYLYPPGVTPCGLLDSTITARPLDWAAVPGREACDYQLPYWHADEYAALALLRGLPRRDWTWSLYSGYGGKESYAAMLMHRPTTHEYSASASRPALAICRALLAAGRQHPLRIPAQFTYL